MPRCQNVFLSPLVGLDIFVVKLARTEVSSEETVPSIYQGIAWHFRCSVIDGENAPHLPFASVSVCDVRDLRHGSWAYFEIKTSRRNSA